VLTQFDNRFIDDLVPDVFPWSKRPLGDPVFLDG